MEPTISYAKSGDVHIAYQMVGSGPIDLLVMSGFAYHLDCAWEHPAVASLWERFAAFCRVIIIDKRGTGLSDRVAGERPPMLEERMDDVRAVMDAVGSKQAALLGFWEGGPMCALFAATYPQRTRALILYGVPAAFRRTAAYPWGPTAEINEAVLASIEARWGDGSFLGQTAPSLAATDRGCRWLARLERQSVSPGGARALWRMNMEIDVCGVLPAIRVPTLVMHRRDDPIIPLEAGRFVAEQIPGARFVELHGVDHLPWVGETDPLVAEVREFLTGTRDEEAADRVLATILFVDIVGSTEHAARLGDRRWRDTLDRFYEQAGRVLERHRGRRIKTTGDGFLAIFDGPARAIRAALDVVAESSTLGLESRAGLHTGECEVEADDVRGIAVHIGARVLDQAAPGAVLVSSTVKDLVAGSGLDFVEAGTHALKGVPGQWRLFRAG